MTINSLDGRRVLVMGLGLHGGGLATVRYLTARGAQCVVTDTRSEEVLRPSLEQLPTDVRLVLGRHEAEDFDRADLVVKNPAVPRSNPFLLRSRAVTTDIALFLAEYKSRGPLVAITGTKGKSTTAGATAHLLSQHYPDTKLGGNITISPLVFADTLSESTPVVLELSSFQLGDLRFCREYNGVSDDPVLSPVLRPQVAAITSIFRDHQDYYGSMDLYVADKRWIYHAVPKDGVCIFPDDSWGRSFVNEARELAIDEERIIVVDSEVPVDRGPSLPDDLALPGTHMRHNLAMAATAAAYCGVPYGAISSSVRTFTGVAHRMETIGHIGEVVCVNDTAATIPEATEAAVLSYRTSFPDAPIVLVAGGTDKNLDLSPLSRAFRLVEESGGEVVLLAGTATDRLVAKSGDVSATTVGPFAQFGPAVTHARRRAVEYARTAILLLSPGTASFGMFRNEFDRGEQFYGELRPFFTDIRRQSDTR